MLTEFDLIKRYFAQHAQHAPNIALGIGDDCALMMPTEGRQIAISSDMLVSGRHFFPDVAPYLLGHKSLAVNLSDLAAMGAKPIAFTLALSLPEANPVWLEKFSQGLFSIADHFQCKLIGGDTTKGPLNICITIFGWSLARKALRRDAAKEGDDIWISGELGDARLSLASYLKQITLSDQQHLQAGLRLHQPTPRIALGIALQDIAHAAIDISDGLIGDLKHILERSKLGADLEIDKLPAGTIVQQFTEEGSAMRHECTLAGGDDYELCFTAPSSKREAVLAASIQSQTPVTRVGSISNQAGLRLIDKAGKNTEFKGLSFDHFAATNQSN